MDSGKLPHTNTFRSGLRVLSALSETRQVIVALTAIILLALGITYVMYQYTQALLTERLQDRLIAIASTAATKFEAAEIDAVRTIDDIEKEAFASLVEKLGDVRDSNQNIEFAYLMRRTADPNVVEFVADSLSLASFAELDANENGVLDTEEEPPMPGDPYEVEEYPVLRDEAFYHPSVDRELQADQWGMIMAAYAPIVDDEGNTVAIVGIDVLVDDFVQRTQATLLPFLLFVFVLLLLITLLTFLLVRINEERVEAMRELDRQKDELLSMVSHQLQTPVSSVKFSLEMLQDGDFGDLNEEQTEQVGKLHGTVRSLAGLVGMILDVSRIQLGRMKVDWAPLDLHDFFTEVLNVIEPKANAKQLDFHVTLPTDLPTALLDKRLMRMTLENLLSNAVKYTSEQGKVQLYVAYKNNQLHYEVADTGCGIPAEEHDQMFTKLYRATNVRNVSGNGFGLFVAKGAVEAQGGSIRFESTEGKGTTFYVTLPLRDPNEDPEATTA